MTSDTWNRENSNLYQHAVAEMKRVGLDQPDADYDGGIYDSVLELIETVARQDHSGASVGLTMMIFNRLVEFKPLGEITDDPGEWMHVADEVIGGDPPIWQNRRQGSVFSNDGGKTYYDLDESPDNDGNAVIHHSKPHQTEESTNA